MRITTHRLAQLGLALLISGCEQSCSDTVRFAGEEELSLPLAGLDDRCSGAGAFDVEDLQGEYSFEQRGQFCRIEAWVSGLELDPTALLSDSLEDIGLPVEEMDVSLLSAAMAPTFLDIVAFPSNDPLDIPMSSFLFVMSVEPVGELLSVEGENLQTLSDAQYSEMDVFNPTNIPLANALEASMANDKTVPVDGLLSMDIHMDDLATLAQTQGVPMFQLTYEWEIEGLVTLYFIRE